MLKCNKCGKIIEKEKQYEEALTVEKTWGYFSNKDGEKHKFTICENCYDDYVKTFCIPLKIEENKEIM